MPTIKPIRVYLSGPITGHSRREIVSWRQSIAESLGTDAHVLDPSKYPYDSVVEYKRATPSKTKAERLRQGRHVVARNRKLIESCDLVIANFLGAGKHASIGAIAEVFLANAIGKPVIVVREERGNVHDHAMLNAVASKVTPTLAEAVAAVPKVARVKRSIASKADIPSSAERFR